MLLSVILTLTLGKQEFSLLLTLAAGALVLAAAMGYLEPVLDFLRELEQVGQLSEGILELLLKATGIALASELISKLCADGGNASLGKSMELLGSAAVLSLSLPVMEGLLDLIRKLLGDL